MTVIKLVLLVAAILLGLYIALRPIKPGDYGPP